MGRIEWIPIEDVSDHLMDGRDLLLWADGAVTVGFGSLEMDARDEKWRSLVRRDNKPISSLTHFAEINGPD